jgi:hypothetical protein
MTTRYWVTHNPEGFSVVQKRLIAGTYALEADAIAKCQALNGWEIDGKRESYDRDAAAFDNANRIAKARVIDK